MKLVAIAVALAVICTAPAAGAKEKLCGVQTHRFGPTATIDDNTLEGLARSTTMGARAEGDLVPLTDGFVIFHERLWQQKSSGIGVPWETDTAYADSLTTTPNGQQIVLLDQALDYAAAHGTKLILELHQWNEAWTQERVEEVIANVQARGMLGQVWFTSTIPGMTALAAVAPEAITVWRVEADQTPTTDFIANRSVEVLQVPHSSTVLEVQTWRSWGVLVQGRRVDPPFWKKAYRLGLRTVQTNEPLRWLRFCRQGGA
jgi:hypothetical protein